MPMEQVYSDLQIYCNLPSAEEATRDHQQTKDAPNQRHGGALQGTNHR
jgi:hypothetical protein